MRTAALFPDAPAVVLEGDRRYVSIHWDEADAVREALLKRGCPTTLCLNPETHQARLELWPGVATELVLAVLEARQSRRVGTAAAPAVVRSRDKTPVQAAADPAEQICV